jgi:hypothetical protein
MNHDTSRSIVNRQLPLSKPPRLWRMGRASPRAETIRPPTSKLTGSLRLLSTTSHSSHVLDICGHPQLATCFQYLELSPERPRYGQSCHWQHSFARTVAPSFRVLNKLSGTLNLRNVRIGPAATARDGVWISDRARSSTGKRSGYRRTAQRFPLEACPEQWT